MKTFLLIIFSTLSFIFPFRAMTQPQCFLKIHKKTVLIGEPFTVSFYLAFSKKDTVNSLDFSNILQSQNQIFSRDTSNFEPFADLELLSPGQWKYFSFDEVLPVTDLPVDNSMDSIILKNKFEVAIYNPGKFNIPFPKLNGKNFTDSIAFTINVTVPKLDSLQQMSADNIYPIKTIDVEPVSWTDFLPWLSLFLGLTFLYFMFKKRMNRKVDSPLFIPEQPIENPDTIALRELEKMKTSQIWKEVEQKEFQTRLTFILREYIEKQIKVPALELSTTECLIYLREKTSVSRELQTSVKHILQYADTIKFSGQQEGNETPDNMIEKVIEFILSTRSLP